MMLFNYNFIGEQIRYLRKNKRLSQARLAELAELSVPYISHIETGRKKPGLETIVKIADALDVTADRLLYGNLKISKNEFIPEFSELLSDCSSMEKYVIYNTAMTIKLSLRKRRV